MHPKLGKDHERRFERHFGAETSRLWKRGMKLEEGVGNKRRRGTKEIASISILGICCN